MLCNKYNIQQTNISLIEYYTTWSGMGLLVAFIAQIAAIVVCKKLGACNAFPVCITKGVLTAMVANSLTVAIMSQVLILETTYQSRSYTKCAYIQVDLFRRKLLLNTLLHILPVIACIVMIVLNRKISCNISGVYRACQVIISLLVLMAFILGWLSRPVHQKTFEKKIQEMYQSPRKYLCAMFPVVLIATTVGLNMI